MWLFRRKKSDEAITDALEAIHRAVEDKERIEELDHKMDRALQGTEERIKQNHFYEAFHPSWSRKGKHA